MSHREHSSSVLVKSEAAKRFSLIKAKGAGEVANRNQILVEIREHEKDHQFLNLDQILQDGKQKKMYNYDH